ncbi:MAG: hypothetical protein IPQ01_19120 [Zoogloea sp.]|nr:hypothetical protein [Zoogloea sp.]
MDGRVLASARGDFRGPVCGGLLRRVPQGGLRLEAVPLRRFALVFLRHLALTYLASGVAVTALALAIIYAITRSAPNALALAVLAGLWLSLWLAPGIASITTWRTLRRAP